MRKYFDLVRPELVAIFAEAISQKKCNSHSKKFDSHSCCGSGRCVYFLDFCLSLALKASILIILLCSFIIVLLYIAFSDRYAQGNDDKIGFDTVENFSIKCNFSSIDKTLCLLSMEGSITSKCRISILRDYKGNVYICEVSATGVFLCVGERLLASRQPVGYCDYHMFRLPLSEFKESP